MAWGGLSEEDIAKAMADKVEQDRATESLYEDRRVGWTITINGTVQRVFGEDMDGINSLVPQAVAAYLADNPEQFEVKWEVQPAYLMLCSTFDELNQQCMELEAENYQYELEREAEEPPDVDNT